MNARKCDACGKLYEAYNYANSSSKPSGIRLLNISPSGEYFQHRALDLCEDCMNKVISVFGEGIADD